MINSLSIQNYIIIEKLDIDFDSGFSVITGETGAGKSIIIGAISLLLGKRAESDVLFSKDKKCIIEAVFDIKELKLQDVFAAHDVDYADKTIVRREILPEGKSRAFINDMPVNLSTLKALTDNFIDLHSQHENLALTTLPYRLQIIDSAANSTKTFAEYQNIFNQFTETKQLLAKKKSELSKRLKDIDYYRFQIQEIENARLADDSELEVLEEKAAVLENAEEIKESLFETENIFENGEYSVKNLLKQMRNNISKVSKKVKAIEDLEQRIESSIIELNDINESISRYSH
ncbi:MAG: AAA family ATPase, partial [Bacteroidales bacterium]|nr:AAA family ATPase [Bacteroidales bacterium]